jgi:phosphoribosylformylglycinamidine synthase subunit PurS
VLDLLHQIIPMSKFKAEIDVMPIEALLDPQGKAVTGSMKNLGLPEITGVRIGKHITLFVDAKDKKTAEAKVDDACKKLLCNEIMEYYSFSVAEEK